MKILAMEKFIVLKMIHGKQQLVCKHVISTITSYNTYKNYVTFSQYYMIISNSLYFIVIYLLFLVAES
ncbi:hypothetical protein COL30_11065 [Bacillus pseudomycoides]|nr:hypothetical protein COO19_27225 [Bacillus pseudomycoides]PEI83603.1 hypothetical protein CN686_28700 [Bacillus pseudomycoides]PEK13002.1 hypothetical protein CN693_25170 [Bacillus pseudomycoides]PEM71489.1 hypothetical protein CN619_18755 [Bacillus pseudomycoides]PEO18114.1 hypothetical protein CN542_14970 [Bacillus pseudomycoides]